MSGYLGRLAGQLAGTTSAPSPTMHIGSPIARHDQLPTVDGLESVGPADNDTWTAAEPPPLPGTPPESSVLDVTAPMQTPRVSTRVPGAHRTERLVPRLEPRARPEAPPTARSLPAMQRTTMTSPSERARGGDAPSRVVVATPAPPRADVPPARGPVSTLDDTMTKSTPPRAPAPRGRPSTPPSGVLDLVRTLGHLSRTIADANQDPTTSSETIVAPPELTPSLEVSRARPPLDPDRTSWTRPPVPELAPLTPDPFESAPDVLMSSPTLASSPSAPGVTIGQLHVEVVREPVPTPRTSPSRPARPPIGPRPSKRRFATGRS